jgi:hypothetical protein
MKRGLLFAGVLGLSLAAMAGDSSAQMQAGMAKIKAKDWAGACEIFRGVTAQDPKNGRAWAELGFCEEKQGHADAAKDAYARVLAVGDLQMRVISETKLHQLGVKTALPEKGCVRLEAPTPTACARPVLVCRVGAKVYAAASTSSALSLSEAARTGSEQSDDAVEVPSDSGCELVAGDACRGELAYACGSKVRELSPR